MSNLSDYRPFADISASYMTETVAPLVIVSKICLKPPCEKYTSMRMNKLELHFSNFSKVNASSPLDDMQPFAVTLLSTDNKNIDLSLILKFT